MTAVFGNYLLAVLNQDPRTKPTWTRNKEVRKVSRALQRLLPLFTNYSVYHSSAICSEVWDQFSLSASTSDRKSHDVSDDGAVLHGDRCSVLWDCVFECSLDGTTSNCQHALCHLRSDRSHRGSLFRWLVHRLPGRLPRHSTTSRRP